MYLKDIHSEEPRAIPIVPKSGYQKIDREAQSPDQVWGQQIVQMHHKGREECRVTVQMHQVNDLREANKSFLNLSYYTIFSRITSNLDLSIAILTGLYNL
jgi:hypothetical protein